MDREPDPRSTEKNVANLALCVARQILTHTPFGRPRIDTRGFASGRWSSALLGGGAGSSVIRMSAGADTEASVASGKDGSESRMVCVFF